MQFMLASPDIDINSEDTIETADGLVYYPLKDETLSKETLRNQLLEIYENNYIDIVNITLHFFLKDVRPMQHPVRNHSTAVA